MYRCRVESLQNSTRGSDWPGVTVIYDGNLNEKNSSSLGLAFEAAAGLFAIHKMGVHPIIREWEQNLKNIFVYCFSGYLTYLTYPTFICMY